MPPKIKIFSFFVGSSVEDASLSDAQESSEFPKTGRSKLPANPVLINFLRVIVFFMFNIRVKGNGVKYQLNSPKCQRTPEGSWRKNSCPQSL